MTYYAALDVSLRSVAICIVDDQGEIHFEESIDSDVEDIVHCFTRFDQPIRSVGLEAGTLTQYLTYGLQKAGFEVICMEARQVKNALSAMRNKTDKNDARGIAQLLRTGWYQQVHVKSIESHHIRALLSSRRAVLQKCMDLENEVRGLLKIFGLKLPARINRGAFDHLIRERISGDEALCHALIPLLEARQALYSTYLELNLSGARSSRETACS
jgi:transposase